LIAYTEFYIRQQSYTDSSADADFVILSKLAAELAD